MIDILFLVGAIALLIVLQMFRGVLAFVFPTAQSRRVDLAKAPEGAADLYAQAHAELTSLGFSGPQWHLLRLGDAAEDSAHFYATYTHERGDVCRLYPLIGLDKPNRLNVVFVTRFVDGRTAIGQAFDPFFEILASERFPARTIGGATLDEQWQAHGEFVASLGAEPDAAGASAEATDAFDGEVHDGARARLLAERKAWLDSRGWARPTLAFAWRMLRAIVRRPKAPPNTMPVPPARLAALALMQQRIVERPAPRRMQAGLFAVSVALFLGLGAVFWSVGFALILFIVIAIHELGHYLAMRAFGYRNVQMLALPLVGGVTIGHEAKPDAARRAWMSLMGPLPGVVIGWAMLLAMPYLGADAPSWWMSAAWVFLAVNYLNVLPVPPLDGGHVVQALLPVRAAKLQAVFIVIACLIGAAVAYYFGFMLLVVLALMQLTLASTHWQLARVIDKARGDAALDSRRPRVLRLRRLFEIADDLIGPTPKAAPRIAQATQALQSLDVKPMRWLQRGAIGTVYAALLAGPVVAAVFMWSLVGWQPSEVDVAERIGRAKHEQATYSVQASALDLGTLLRDNAIAVDDNATLPAPASEDVIAVAQTRLGTALPEELAALYRTHNGAPALGLLPLESVIRLQDAPGADLEALAPNDAVEVYVPPDRDVFDPGLQARSVSRHRAGSWLLLSKPEDGYFVAYDIGEAPAVAGYRLIDVSDGVGTATKNLRTWLETSWVAQQQMRSARSRHEERVDAVQRELAGLSLSALIDRLPRPGLAERLLASGVFALPPPATAEAITTAEARIGLALADELHELYALHDGVPIMQLFAAAEVYRLDLADATVHSALSAQLELRDTAKPRDNWPTIGELDGCVVIGGHAAMKEGARLLWCPGFDALRRYVDLNRQETYARLTDFVRMRVALVVASAGDR